MKKVINILLLILIIISSYLLNSSILLPISLGLGLIYYSLLSTFNISTMLSKYSNKQKIFYISSIIVLLISMIFSVLSFIIGSIINIKYLSIINICIILFITSNILIKTLSSYINEIKYKKLSNRVIYTYYITTIVLSIIYIIMSKIFNLKEYLNIIILSSIFVAIYIILFILLYFLVFRKEKYEKERINYISTLKKIIITNKNKTLYNLINASYVYTSVIILYYSLTYKYNYNINDINNILTNYFIYGLLFIYILNIIISKYIKDKHYINNINYILKISILIMVISGPLCNLIFNKDNFLLNIMPLFIMYNIYSHVINKCIDNKKTRLILIISLIVKVIFEVPLINTIYRMGYDLVFGSISSIIIGLIISITLCLIIYRSKLKINILDKFNKILSIIYENIIYSLILVLLTLLVKVNTINKLNSLLVIIFYIIVSIIFYIIKKFIKKK